MGEGRSPVERAPRLQLIFSRQLSTLGRADGHRGPASLLHAWLAV